MPMPSALLVKNGSKTCFNLSSGIPGPRSDTDSSANSSTREVRMLMMRFSVGVSLIASIPFTTRFRMTCCSWTRSPRIGGTSGVIKLVSSTFRPAAREERTPSVSRRRGSFQRISVAALCRARQRRVWERTRSGSSLTLSRPCEPEPQEAAGMTYQRNKACDVYGVRDGPWTAG
jgi:hypothetical protein